MNNTRFKGTIVIVDPLFIAKKSKDASTDWGNVFDYNTSQIKSSKFTNYLWTSTGVGDGRWKVSETNLGNYLDLTRFVDRIETAYYDFYDKSSIENEKILNDLISKQSPVGRVYVSSGSMGVFLLDEVLSYNPEFLTDTGDWCYTVIPDFDGEVSTFVNSRGYNHLLCYNNFKSYYSSSVLWL